MKVYRSQVEWIAARDPAKTTIELTRSTHVHMMAESFKRDPMAIAVDVSRARDRAARKFKSSLQSILVPITPD